MATKTPGFELVPVKCQFDNLAKSAANIALSNFHWEYVTFVLYNTALICGIPTFVKTYGKSVVIGRHVLYPIIPAYTRQIVLFGIDLEDIRNMLGWMRKYEIDNTGKCIVICESYKTYCNELEIINLLWEFNITNVIFLKFLNSNTIAGYTYFFGNNCAITPAIKVFEWDLRRKQNLTKRMFPMKFENMHGCPLIVSTFIQKPYMRIHDNVPSGADGDFLRIIVEAINASLKLMTPTRGTGWGYLDRNGTWVGSLGDVYYNLANVSMTSAAITQSRYQYFQISKNYYLLSVVWITHPLEMEPASMKLLRPLGMKTRIAFVLSLLITLLFILLLKRINSRRLRTRVHLKEFPDQILLHCWEICMGLPIKKMPTQTALLYLILIWIWYCFLIRTFYQVYLIDCLKNDVYLTGFVHINDAINKGYTFGSGPALKDYFIDHPEMYNNWINKESDDMYQTMLDISHGKKFVLAMNLATAQIFIKETKRKLFVLPGKIISTHSVLFLKKYSPLEPILSKILTQLFECGWPQKIYKNNTLHNYKTLTSNDDRPIKLQHFTGCYIIIVTGWIISLTSFVVEICTYKK